MVNSVQKDQWHMFRFSATKAQASISQSENDLIEQLKNQLATSTDDDLGAWSDIKRKLKAKFDSLKDEDLYIKEGREEEVIRGIVKKVGSDNIAKLKQAFS